MAVSKPRILLLHPARPSQARNTFCTPVINWFQNLAMQGKIDLQVEGLPSDSEGMGTSCPPLKAADPARIDGIVTIALISEQYLADLAALRIPMVVLDHQPLPSASVDSVAFNNMPAAENLGRRITNLGHRDALYVSRFLRDPLAVANADPFIEAPSSAERRNGLIQAFEGTQTNMWGIFPWHTFGGPIGADARADARWRMDKTFGQIGKYPDCIVTVDYAVAEEFHLLLQERGLSVPKDISLATFQLHPYCEEQPQRLHVSHMRYDYLQMAAEGWRLLSARLASPTARAAPPQAAKVGSTFFDCGTLADRRAV
jgi:DNA-binding LacI/PurR family transcriptional regulator